MAKIVLDTVTGGYDLSVINNNFDKIETEFQNKVLYRDNPVGEVNTLQSDIDANSKRLYNLPTPVLASEAARLQDIQGMMNGLGNLVQFTPYKNISSINLQSAIQEEIDDLESTAGASLIGYAQAGTGAALQTIQSKFRERFTPEDYGAVGDGVADDTTPWTNMLARVQAVGGGIIEAKKTYNVPSGITLSSSNTILDGCGTGKIKSSGLVSEAIYAVNKNNIVVKNIRVEIPRANLRSGKFCVLFETSTDITVRDVNTDGGTVGIWTINCENVLVEGCYIDTPKADGIHFGHGSRKCKAIGNTIIDPGDDALSTTFYTGYPRPTDIVFANNIVRGGYWGFGAAVYSGDRVTIVGNTFSETALGGVSLSTHDGGAIPTSVVVTGNNIDGSNRAEKQPDSYWNGTDPGLDPAVTSDLHKSSIVVTGTDILVEGNKIGNVTSLPGGLSRRGLTLNGGSRITISNNAFFSVNGDGINGGTVALAQLCIDRNTFESVLGVAIRSTVAISTSLSICGNTQGFGATLGDPYIIYLTGTGSVLAMVNNNNSSGGRGVFVDGLNPQLANYNNISGKASFITYSPTVTSGAGTLTSTSVTTAKYQTQGQICFVNLRVVITDNGTGSSDIRITLPFAASGIGNFSGREEVLSGVMVHGQVTGSTLIVRKYDNSYPGGTNAAILVSGFFEIA